MANRKRAIPLTPAESKARNRRYAAKRRHKTNNNYSRAYRRAGQRAVKYVQRYHNHLWIQWLDEELEKGDGKPMTHANTNFDGTPVDKKDCEHGGDVFVTGVGIGCAVCGAALGIQQLTYDQRATIAELIGAVDPKEEE